LRLQFQRAVAHELEHRLAYRRLAGAEGERELAQAQPLVGLQDAAHQVIAQLPIDSVRQAPGLHRGEPRRRFRHRRPPRLGRAGG
jgi:hypothetical protein